MQTVATSETGAVHDKSGWCLVEEAVSPVINALFEDKSSEMRHDEYMQAMVTGDQERQDVSTTASDGDVSTRWLKV